MCYCKDTKEQRVLRKQGQGQRKQQKHDDESCCEILRIKCKRLTPNFIAISTPKLVLSELGKDNMRRGKTSKHYQ